MLNTHACKFTQGFQNDRMLCSLPDLTEEVRIEESLSVYCPVKAGLPEKDKFLGYTVCFLAIRGGFH